MKWRTAELTKIGPIFTKYTKKLKIELSKNVSAKSCFPKQIFLKKKSFEFLSHSHSPISKCI